MMPVRSLAATPGAALETPARRAAAQRVDMVLIGASTGGPTALGAVLRALPGDLPVPVVIVQHLPEAFADLLAERMHAQSSLTISVASEGVVPEPGQAWLAPGGRHLVITRGADGITLGLDDGPKVQSCRPAVDVLFASAAPVFGANVLGVVLTGMGYDGLDGTRALMAKGARVVVQDAATSVVWGMPGAVARAGLADAIVPLDKVAPEIVRRVGVGRAWSR